jgi:hypothetical protein
MNIRDLHTRYTPESLSLQRATTGSRIAPAPVDSSADAWLEPALSDFISLASSVCGTPMGMFSQLHADIGLHHPYISVINGRGDCATSGGASPARPACARGGLLAVPVAAPARPDHRTHRSAAHPRFAEARWPMAIRVRFYAAVSLVSGNGDMLGTCA